MNTFMLKDTNWNIVSSGLFDLAQNLEQQGLIEIEAIMQVLVARGSMGICANPLLTDFGKVDLLSGAIETAIAKNQAQGHDFIFSNLKKISEFEELYHFSTNDGIWKIEVKSFYPTRDILISDFDSKKWILIFQTEQGFTFYPLEGKVLIPFLELFSLLNGNNSQEMILENAQRKGLGKIFNSFLSFALQNALVEICPLASSIPDCYSGIELVSHSSVIISDNGNKFFLDPAFYKEDINSNAYQAFRDSFKQIPMMKGIFISHHHWDHLHIPSLVRFDRNTPIYIPKVSNPSCFNPTIKPLISILGFKNIFEVSHWDEIKLTNQLSFTGIPFHGEWFGPNSSFNGFTCLFKLNDNNIFLAIDSDRDDNGNMCDIIKRLSSKISQLDYLFFCSSGMTHILPAASGRPFYFSNQLENCHEELLRFHPNTDVIYKWSQLIKINHFVPYAEFIFKRIIPVTSNKLVSNDREFEDFWKEVSTFDMNIIKKYNKWITDLYIFNSSLQESRLLMLASGDRVDLSKKSIL